LQGLISNGKIFIGCAASSDRPNRESTTTVARGGTPRDTRIQHCLITPERFAMLTRFLKNYVARHQNPANRALHVVGIPLTFVVSVVLLIMNHPQWAGLAFVGGYVLQIVGHAIEGNDPGELILL
jgi:hypothetical protein